MRKVILTTALAMLALGGTAQASTTTPLVNQNTYSVGQGDFTLNFGIEPRIFISGGTTSSVRLLMGANYFLTDIFAPGLEIDYEHQFGTDMFRFLPNLKAYWPGLGRVLPYALIGMGYAHAVGGDFFDLAIGPGIDFMLTNNVALGFQFRYDLLAGSGTAHELQFPLVFGLYFKL